jgi:hypothetical protein
MLCRFFPTQHLNSKALNSVTHFNYLSKHFEQVILKVRCDDVVVYGA